MAIEFHCDHCGRLVRAPDDASGKHGKCPTCHQTVYIPTPSDQIETLDLAPIDESAEQERARLLQESREVQRRLLEERDLPDTIADAAMPAPPAGAARPRRSAVDVELLVIDYALAMASGDLEQAERIASNLRPEMARAEDVMQRLTADEIPHERLINIPRPVLVGFFRQLRESK